jgi:hypothetical protein
MNNLKLTVEEFDRACSLLPAEKVWGDHLTPEIVLHIAGDATAEATARLAALEAQIAAVAPAVDALTTGAVSEPVALSDEWIELYAQRHIAPHAEKMKKSLGLNVPYQQTEQFKRIKAYTVDVIAAIATHPTSKPQSEAGAKPVRTFTDAAMTFSPSLMAELTDNPASESKALRSKQS